MPSDWQTIHLNRAAPTKPARGTPCNGCGVCCAAAPCPLAILIFRRGQGPCPALEWCGTAKHYRCGLLMAPARYLRWLPARWSRRIVARAIAAGSGCDSDATPEYRDPA